MKAPAAWWVLRRETLRAVRHAFPVDATSIGGGPVLDTVMTAKVDRDLAEAMRATARLNDRTLSAEVRRALRSYLSTMNDESPVVTPGSREISAAGVGRHDCSV